MEGNPLKLLRIISTNYVNPREEGEAFCHSSYYFSSKLTISTVNCFLWDAQQFGVDLGLTSCNKNGAHATGDAGQPASLTDVRDTY